MSAEMISILDGSTFAVSNRAGDMDAGPDQPHGFFYKDTRHLSRWVLTVNGVAPAALSTDTVEYYFAQFFLAPPTGTIYQDPSLSLIRRRLIGEGFVEELTLMNHGAARPSWSSASRRGPTSPTCSRSRTSSPRRAPSTGRSAAATWCWATAGTTSSARRRSARASPPRWTGRPSSSGSGWRRSRSGRPGWRSGR